jgi:hypothetical protein
MAFYIGGPVERMKSGLTLPVWVYHCYGLFEKIGGATRPLLERGLDELEAQSFSREVFRRIRDSEGVMAVFLPGDSGTPVECAVAALSGKQVLIVAEPFMAVPRVLLGMPSVRVTTFDSGTSKAVERFVNSIRRL